MDASDRSRRRDLAQAERQLGELLDEWDPLGVYVDDGWPPGEYGSFTWPILRRLVDGVSVSDLTLALEQLATDVTGIAPTGDEAEVARRLLDWWADRGRP